MKRFYKAVTVAEAGGGFQLMLDGRALKTQGGAAQIVPTRALAEALAAEWAGQGDMIDPRGFILRDMADLAIDVIMPDPEATIAAILGFAETDTLLYRAEAGEPLRDRQDEVWDPFVRAAEARHDIHFDRIAGIIHRPQSGSALAALRRHLTSLSLFHLAALQTLASLAASLIIALAALDDGADADQLWNAANLEEDWQADLWGWVDDAEELRALRLSQFRAAMDLSQLVG